MFLGVEIGGTKLQLIAGSPERGIVRRARFLVRKELGGPGICQQILAGVRELGGDDLRFEAVGIGFGGPIDVRTGRVRTSHQIEGWDDFPLRDWLAEQLKLPVIVDNDANTACLGEARRGAGKGMNPVFFCTLGSGVGGGIVAGDHVYHGLPPGEVEFGHLLLDRDGVIVESRCSGWAVDGRIRELCRREPDCALARLTKDQPAGGEAKHLAAALAQNDAAALAQNDAAARSLLTEVTTDIAFALSHVVHLFHPQVLILGGGLSLVGEPLRAGVETALPQFVMKAFHPVPLVRLPELGEDSVPIGALELAADAATKHIG